MATAFLSDQETLVAANPPRKVAPDVVSKVYRISFTKTLPASGLATGDTIQLGRIPTGARPTGGQFCWNGTQGATATTAIGSTASAAKYFAAAVTASAAVFRIADTQAQNYQVATTADEILIATNAAAAWTASAVLTGHFDYELN